MSFVITAAFQTLYSGYGATTPMLYSGFLVTLLVVQVTNWAAYIWPTDFLTRGVPLYTPWPFVFVPDNPCLYEVFKTSPTYTSKMTFDYIIAGGGVAGSVLANRLSENGTLKILLIEAGDTQKSSSIVPGLYAFTYNNSATFNFTASASANYSNVYKNFQLPIYQGRAIGGSSITGEGVWQCGVDSQYNRWANISGSVKWSYSGLLNYIRKCTRQTDISRNYTWYGQAGPVTLSTCNSTTVYNPVIKNAFAAANYSYVKDYANGTYNGVFDFQAAVKLGERQSAGCSYLLPSIYQRPNLFVIRNGFVSRVIINSSNVTTGVEVKIQNSTCTPTLTFIVRREAILTAGALSTPKILMSSGIGLKFDLDKWNISARFPRWVGYNLRDNPYCTTFWTVNASASASSNVTFQSLQYTSDYYYNRSSYLTGSGLFQTQAAINLTTTDPSASPDCGFQFTTFRKGDVEYVRQYFTNAGYNDTYIAKLMAAVETKDLIMCNTVLYNAQSTGTVKLSANYATNPYANPTINTGYFSVSADAQVLAQAQAFLFNNITASASFQAVGATFYNFSEPQFTTSNYSDYGFWSNYFKFFTGSSYSFSGTAKLGVASDPTAVVDANFRVFGVKGLRIADASIFPFVPSAGLQCSVYATAEFAADVIKSNV